jgi:hypothetical protein
MTLLDAGVEVPRDVSVARRSSVIALCLLLACTTIVDCSGGSTSDASAALRLELALGSAHRSRIPPALVVGRLDPGKYSTTRFAPRVTLSLGDGWNLVTETPAELALSRGPLSAFGPTQLRFVALKRAWQLFPPFVGDTDTLRDWSPRSRRAPADYMAFVRSLTGNLQVDTAPNVRIAGRDVPALQYTVVHVPTSLPGTCDGGPGPCFAPPTGIWLDYVSLPRGSTVRIAVVTTNDGPLLVEAEAPDVAQLDALLDQVVQLLDTLKLG